MDAHDRKLLVLDLDETLVHARAAPLAHAEDFRVGPWLVYRRPHLAAFVEDVARHFELAVWTASSATYAREVVAQVFPEGLLRFVWSSDRCTTARDWRTGEYTTRKRLSKVKRLGYRLEQVVVVDDTPGKHLHNYGNLVAVREFLGDRADSELPLLATYLAQLAAEANVRTIEKRGWRMRVGAAGHAGD